MPESTPPTRLADQRRPIRVVLAEDHDGMRRSLRLVLEGAGGIEVIGEATELVVALDEVLSLGPDVLVIDLSMRGGSSLELIEHMRQEQPSTEIVVVTMLESHAFARRAWDVGARGFVVKDAADSELAVAVRRAARHVRYTSPRVAEALI